MNLAFVPNLSIITLAWFSHGHALEANRFRSDSMRIRKAGREVLKRRFAPTVRNITAEFVKP